MQTISQNLSGLSDSHNLIVTVMQSHIPKQLIKIIKLKDFNKTKFKSELPNILHLNIHEGRNLKKLELVLIFRNICVTLLRKAKRDYHENVDLSKVNDPKNYLNTVKSETN